MVQQSLQAVSEFARPCVPHAILARFAHDYKLTRFTRNDILQDLHDSLDHTHY